MERNRCKCLDTYYCYDSESASCKEAVNRSLHDIISQRDRYKADAAYYKRLAEAAGKYIMSRARNEMAIELGVPVSEHEQQEQCEAFQSYISIQQERP